MKPSLWMIPQRLQSATCWLMVFAMVTLNPLAIQGQPLVSESGQFTPIASGTNSSYTIPTRAVIQDPTTYANFFNGSPPVTPVINFALQDVLAVTMGTAPTGSSISIPQISIDTTGFTAGWGHVYVSQTVGPGGITLPVTFSGGSFTNSGGNTANTGGTVTMTGTGITIGTVIVNGVSTTQVTDTGGASIAGGTTTTVGGTTNATESNGTTLTDTGGTTTNTGGTNTATGTVVTTGGTITSSGPTGGTLPTITITGGTTTTSGISTTGGTTTISGGTATGGGATCNPYAVIAVPKGALFYNFVNTVTPAPFTGSVLPFSSISYVIGDETTPYIEWDTFDSAGYATVNRSRGTTGGTTISGGLRPSELQALGSAFLTANFATLPPTITDPLSPGTPILSTETYTATVNGAVDSTIVLAAGFYGAYPGLKLLADAIRGPVERIKRASEGDDGGGRELEGIIRANATTLTVGSEVISPDDPFYDALVKLANQFAQREVELGAAPSPTGISVMGVGTHLIAPGSLVGFPNLGANVLATLPTGTSVQVTDATLFGNYFEVLANGQRGFVQTSSVVAAPSAAGQANIKTLLYRASLNQAGLYWNATGWIDPATGQVAPAPAGQWTLNAGSIAFPSDNQVTGQTAYYDDQARQWYGDTGPFTTGPLSPSGNSPAALQNLAFQLYLQEDGLYWNGSTGQWFNSGTGQSAPAPTASWQISCCDPDRATNSITGQTAIYDHVNAQWVDATTGQPLSPSLK